MSSSSVYWLNEQYWVCAKHAPSVRITASHPDCWYLCGSQRPLGTAIKHRSSSSITQKKIVPVSAIKDPVELHPPEPVLTRVGLETIPSPSEKLRGATYLVHCEICKKNMWKRKKESLEGGPFFCGLEHRKKFSSNPE